MKIEIKCEGCGKPNPTMQCPKCKELCLPTAFFCGQKCYADSWSEHKKRHTAESVNKYFSSCSIKTMSDIQAATFKFTGPLRPGLITPTRPVSSEIKRPDYVNTPDGLSANEESSYRHNRIPVNSPEQILKIKRCCRIAREVLEVGIKAAVEGATTDSIDSAVHNACIERAVYPSPLGYGKFPKSVCTSINEVICHGIPDSTVLKEGDIINLDVTCYSSDGVHADLSETVFIGKPSEEDVRLVHATWETMIRAINTQVKVGSLYRHIGDFMEPFVNAQGFSVVRDIVSHGVGQMFHCAPEIPHYGHNKAVGKMAVGHVFTVEPMVNAGTSASVTWDDNWTITTKDGKKSAQFEHTVAVLKEGVEILTLPEGEDKRPYYQKQLEQWDISLPPLKE